MHNKFIWTNSAGEVIVSKPNYAHEGFAGMSDDEILQAYIDQKAPVMNGAAYVILPMEEKTASGKAFFRNAWVIVNSDHIEVDMPKARLMHMDDIRIVRDDELVKESGSKYRQPPELEALFTLELLAKLQVLRDIPQTFDLSGYTTPETLKAAWPTELPPP